jgi:hypothetical protein
MKWRDVLAAATPAMQNASKREAIARVLKAHPDWSNRKIAQSVHLLILTDLDLDAEVSHRGCTRALDRYVRSDDGQG